jgi:hypothetical protein
MRTPVLQNQTARIIMLGVSHLIIETDSGSRLRTKRFISPKSYPFVGFQIKEMQ